LKGKPWKLPTAYLDLKDQALQLSWPMVHAVHGGRAARASPETLTPDPSPPAEEESAEEVRAQIEASLAEAEGRAEESLLQVREIKQSLHGGSQARDGTGGA